MLIYIFENKLCLQNKVFLSEIIKNKLNLEIDSSIDKLSIPAVVQSHSIIDSTILIDTEPAWGTDCLSQHFLEPNYLCMADFPHAAHRTNGEIYSMASDKEN